MDPGLSESEILAVKMKEITKNTKGTIPILMYSRYLRGRLLAESCETVEQSEQLLA
jgi:hypothetical protein